MTPSRILLTLTLCAWPLAAVQAQEKPAAAAPAAVEDVEDFKDIKAAVAEGRREATPKSYTDPAKGIVPLPARRGWNASLVVDNGSTGIWTVGAFDVYPDYGITELVGLDDKGRCIIHEGYSGKWTPTRVVDDKLWLGGLAFGDVDPRMDGSELYTGGKRGNLYMICYHRGAFRTLDARLIAQVPDREIHTIVTGDLDPATPGNELLFFTRPGGLYQCTPTGEHGRWETRKLQDLFGRVRAALVLPAAKGEAPEIACVSLAGEFQTLQLTPKGPRWRTIHKAAMGMGRVALRPPQPGRPTTVYTTLDDGRVMRHERRSATAWDSTTIYAGPQGPRGVAAGRFDADPEVETIAVFGYSHKVQLLSRRGEQWEAETIFIDRDKGHWLCAAELDGRNGTHELVASGYGARMVLLSRPPGYGRQGLAVDPGDATDTEAPPAEVGKR